MAKIVSERLFSDDFKYEISINKCFCCGESLEEYSLDEIERFCIYSSEGEKGSIKEVAVCEACYEKSVEKTNGDKANGEVYAYRCDFCEVTFPYGLEGMSLVSENGKTYFVCGGCLSRSEAKKIEEQNKKLGFFSTLKPCRDCGKLIFESGFQKKCTADFWEKEGWGKPNFDRDPKCPGSCR